MVGLKRLVRHAGRGLVVLGLGLGVGIANAGLQFAHLEIAADDGAGNQDVKTFEAVFDGEDVWEYESSATDMFMANGVEIATLNPDLSGLDPAAQALHQHQTGMFYQSDPIVNLNFSVQAAGSATTFTITSALLTFSTINAPIGQTGASFAVSDTNFDGVTLTGALPSSGMSYRAAYNGFAGADLGTTFATHIASLSAGPLGSNSVTEAQTPIAIGTPVSDISSKIRFTLSAGDLASGSTGFEVVPEPASLMLMLLGVGLIRRR